MVILILKFIFKRMVNAGTTKVKIFFSNGSTFTNCTGEEVADLQVHFHTRWAEWRTVLFLPTGFFDAYIAGDIDLEGENPIYTLAKLGRDAGEELLNKKDGRRPAPRHNPLVWVLHTWMEWTGDNIVRERAMKNADFHYALPVELFKYKLGETVGYSEGYWVEGTKTLNQAKHNLYEYICQKLDLKPGMKVLEVGSGWGFLPIYMVKNYDVEVTVYNPVKAQNDYMRARFKRHGVEDRIRLVEGDHRDISEEAGTFDRFVSIGVHEHHGMRKEMYHLWWRSIYLALKDDGLGVISTSSFMDYGMTGYLTLRYIWPGGHIPSVPLEISTLHEEGFTLVEWENLLPHYYRTLKEWRDRFKKYWPDIQRSNPEVFTEQFHRRWLMYLEAVPESFERHLDSSHFIFTKGRNIEKYPTIIEGRYQKANFKIGNDEVECYE